MRRNKGQTPNCEKWNIATPVLKREVKRFRLDQICSYKQRHHTRLQCFYHLFLLAEIGTLGLGQIQDLKE